MKGMNEQPAAVSIFMATLFSAGEICIFEIVAAAIKSGVVDMIGGGSDQTRLYRANTPQAFWMCVLIYVLAGLGCLGGIVYHLRKLIRKRKTSA
jgi:hypothetical protein